MLARPPAPRPTTLVGAPTPTRAASRPRLPRRPDAAPPAVAVALDTEEGMRQANDKVDSKRLALSRSAGAASTSTASSARATLLSIISRASGRGKSGLSPGDAAVFADAVATLEADGGTPARARTADPRLYGRWSLLFTSNAARTASPIQRSFTGSDAVAISQEIEPAVVNQASGQLVAPVSVTNVVEAAALGTLRVRARAATAAAPIPGFTPRAGAGIPLLGKSSSARPTQGPGTRLDFAFQSAAFYWRAGVPLPSLPYPVPFSLFEKLGGPLADEVKGWLDVTYLSPDGAFRLSRGNKGTLFVLARPDVPGAAAQLAGARAGRLDASAVLSLATTLAASGAGVPDPARSPLAAGRWRLVWSEQAADANPLQAALADKVNNWQVVGLGEGGEGVENVVNLLPGGAVQVVALGVCAPASPTRTSIDITGVEIRFLGGLLRLPLSSNKKSDKAPTGLRSARPTTARGAGFIDWLFLSPSLRVTRGSKGSLFVHVRDD